MSLGFRTGKNPDDRRAEFRGHLDPILHQLYVRRALVLVRLGKIIAHARAADIETQLKRAPFEFVDERIRRHLG